MRKNKINLRILFFILLSIVMINTNAQTGLNFQGVARTTNNVILASQAITIKLSILKGSATGTVEYTETRRVITNAQGLFTAVIGDTGAISTLGNFTNINWKLTPKFLKIEMDAAAGNNFITMGTTQFQYVAYAQFAKSVDAENIVGIVPVTLGGTGVSTIAGLKTALVLNNVNNTTDLTKPISTLTQTALDLKLNATDTSKYTKQTYSDSSLLTKLKISDTAAMLSSRIARDTLNLSNRINFKANIIDLTSGLDLKLNKVDTIKFTKQSYSDSSLLTKLKISDTAAMLSSRIARDTLNLSNRINFKANTTDVTSGLDLKLNKADTIKFTKQSYSDSSLLTKLKISDTAVMLSSRIARDTLNLSNRINLKANTTDGTAGLALKENISNKSTAVDLGGTSPSDILFPTQKAVKDYVTANNASGGISDGSIITIKIADGAVTDAKINTVSGSKVVGNITVNAATATLATLATTATTAGNITATSNTTLTSLQNLNTVGTITSGIWSGTAVAVEKGGTAATTATAARTNLGLAVGSDVLAYRTFGTAANNNTVDFEVPLFFTSPLSRVTNTISIPAATTSLNGYLSSTDWTTFNAKQTALTAGSGISISAGTISATGLTTSNLSSTAGITNTQLAGSIAASKLVGTDITTLGTIISGVWSGTAVAVEKGGTGATTASAARINLGLEIGSNVQAPLTAGTDYLAPTGSAASLTNFPTFNQSTSGNALTATTSGNITATTNTTLTSLSNLATVGTITSGVWSGTSIGVAKGGTGLTASGTANQVLTSTGSGTLTWTTPSTNNDILEPITIVSIGEAYQGGVVAYILQVGDPGYDPNFQKGLIAATSDQSAGIRWYNGTSSTTGATGTAIGTGFANTNTIISSQGGTPTSYAAGLARAHNGGGYTDWYLPSKDELAKLYAMKLLGFGGFASFIYWSSTENGVNYARDQDFSNGDQVNGNKGYTGYVRAIRAFSSRYLNSTITGSSLTSVGTLSSGAVPYSLLTGTVPTWNQNTTGNAATATTATTATTSGNITATTNTTLTSLSNLNTIGTITSGVWSGTAVAVEKGGTGLTAAGTDGQVLTSTASGTLTWTGTHYIGESYGGGIVFYVYDNGKHGLIAATSDQSTGIRWYGGSNTNTRARGDGVGAGLKNTAIIIANQGAVDGSAFAATVCNEYSVTETVGGITTTYGDWYLPSKHELNLMYTNIGQGALSPNTNIGGFAVTDYWSSTEIDDFVAWYQYFSNGIQFHFYKSFTHYVRAIRAF